MTTAKKAKAPTARALAEWPDGINPYVTPERREAILATRELRKAEIKKWHEDHP